MKIIPPGTLLQTSLLSLVAALALTMPFAQAATVGVSNLHSESDASFKRISDPPASSGLANSFTTGSGTVRTLDSATVDVRNASAAATLQASIYANVAGHPGGSALATSSPVNVPASPVGTVRADYHFDFSGSPLTLTSGTTYWLRLDVLSGGDGVTSWVHASTGATTTDSGLLGWSIGSPLRINDDSWGFVSGGPGLFSINLATDCSVTTSRLAGVLDGNMHMTFHNTEGLASVQALTRVNCTISGTAYDALGNSLGAFGPVVVETRTDLPAGTVGILLIASKVSPADPATVNVITKDLCDQGVSFDPVITTLEVLSGDRVEQRHEGLLSAEHYLFVQNDNPGLQRLEVDLNGRVFAVDLSNGQSFSSDLRQAMLEGSDNVVMLRGYGSVGSKAFVTLTDTPSSDIPQELEEIVRLTTVRNADGLKLSWPGAVVGWTLQRSAQPNAAWADITTPPSVESGQWTITVPPTTGVEFYRLKAPTQTASPAAKIKVSTTVFSTSAPHESLLW